MGLGARVKGYIEIGGVTKKFIYNPESYGYEYSTDFASVKSPGSPHPVYQFASGSDRNITMTLLLDGVEKGYQVVREWMFFLGRSYPANRGLDKYTKPPTAVVALGWFAKRVLIRNVRFNVIMMDENLNPTRVEAEIEMIVIR